MFSYVELYFFIDYVNRTPIESIKITEDRSLFTQKRLILEKKL